MPWVCSPFPSESHPPAQAASLSSINSSFSSPCFGWRNSSDSCAQTTTIVCFSAQGWGWKAGFCPLPIRSTMSQEWETLKKNFLSYLIYNVLPISAVQQSDLTTYFMCIHTHTHTHSFSHYPPSYSITSGLVPCAIQQDLIFIHSNSIFGIY